MGFTHPVWRRKEGDQLCTYKVDDKITVLQVWSLNFREVMRFIPNHTAGRKWKRVGT